MDLAHKDEEHEEAAKEIETVDHPEEHLQVGGVVTQPALHFCVCNIIDLLCCPICICVTTRLDGWRAECSGLLRTSTRFQGSGTAWCRAPCILQWMITLPDSFSNLFCDNFCLDNLPTVPWPPWTQAPNQTLLPHQGRHCEHFACVVWMLPWSSVGGLICPFASIWWGYITCAISSPLQFALCVWK